MEPLEARAMCSADTSSELWGGLPPTWDASPVGLMADSGGWYAPGKAPTPKPRVVDDAPNLPGSKSPSINLNTTGNGSRVGRLEKAGDHDAFRVDVKVAGSYQFDQLGSSLSDSFLRLLDAKGRQLASDDNGAAGLNSRITRDLTPGTYYLVAGAKGDRLSGAYTLVTRKQQAVNTAPAWPWLPAPARTA